jgi:DNA-binding IclR family transcriptional regulator
VRGGQGRLLAALSLEAPAEQMASGQLKEFLQPLNAAALAIAETLVD